MAPHRKNDSGRDRLSAKTRLKMPGIGMESEFNVWIDDVEVDPRVYFEHPSTFIDRPLLPREKSSLQLPTGGAVYFDRGVIEVVTPVIELAPESTARMVRNLWEQIAFVREELTKWEARSGHRVRLKGYSSHYNISYEIPESKQSKTRNEKTLALLLAYILPVPVMLIASNRRSTGVGVRPRGGRLEITVDFTPDPGLMVAAATLIVGIVREVMTWPSYDLSMLKELGIPVIDGVLPGKHTTRKGWLTKDIHYEHSPYTCDVDAPIWATQFRDGESLRGIGRKTAWFFRKSIRRYSDPFSARLLYAVLTGRATSLLELADRPSAYDDVGHLCRWGSVIPELRTHEHPREPDRLAGIHEHIASRDRARSEYLSTLGLDAELPSRLVKQAHKSDKTAALPVAPEIAVSLTPTRETPRSTTRHASEHFDRRGFSLLPAPKARTERRMKRERRTNAFAIPFPDRRLTRSAYELVFLKLVSGRQLRIGRDLYTPVGMKGWYHAVFRRDSDKSEKVMTIDQLLARMGDWVG